MNIANQPTLLWPESFRDISCPIIDEQVHLTIQISVTGLRTWTGRLLVLPDKISKDFENCLPRIQSTTWQIYHNLIFRRPSTSGPQTYATMSMFKHAILLAIRTSHVIDTLECSPAGMCIISNLLFILNQLISLCYITMSTWNILTSNHLMRCFSGLVR